MLVRKATALAALAVVSILVSTARPSAADEVVIVAHSGHADSGGDGSYADLRQITGGAIMFGVSYAIVLGVAGESGHQGDRDLYVPLVGPWIDLADRGHCPVGWSCNQEFGNRALLVTDGVFQAIGVLAVVSGFVFPRHYERRTATTTAPPTATIQIAPVQYPHGGLGLAAVGTF